MLIAKVVPQTRLPANLDFFDYAVPEEMLAAVKIGSLVKISFRKQTAWGIVFQLSNHSRFSADKLKPISEISAEAALPATVVKLMSNLADDLLLSPALVAHAFLPEIPKRLGVTRKVRSPAPARPVTADIRDIEALKASFKEITGPQHRVLVHYHFENDKEVLVYKLTQKALKERKKLLIISPQINSVSRWQSVLAPLRGRFAVLHGDMNKTEFWNNWKAAVLGRADIVVGTRGAALAPMEKTDYIILDRPENEDFKQSDQNPRYDSREIAYQRSGIDGAKLILLSQTPRVADYYGSQEENRFHLVSVLKDSENLDTELVDLKNVQKEGSPYLSLGLLDQIKETLSEKKKVFLLVNRKGLAGALTCQDCGHTVNCPDCKVPLTYHQDYLVCNHCQRRSAIPIFCTNCHGNHLAPAGHGLERIQSALKKIFGASMVESIDTDNLDYLGNGPIVLATQVFIHRYLEAIPDLGLIGVLSLDNLLYLPDFNAAERAYQIFSSLIHFASGRRIPIWIQTYHSNNPTIQAAVQDDYRNFYQRESLERQALGYPPFARLVKIIIKKDSREAVSDMADKLKFNIKKGVGSYGEVFGPTNIYKTHQTFHAALIIKVKPGNFSVVKSALETIKAEAIIDINPNSLL